jgi:hypothetical protein
MINVLVRFPVQNFVYWSRFRGLWIDLQSNNRAYAVISIRTLDISEGRNEKDIDVRNSSPQNGSML